jgi:hypothetical protein
LAGIDKDHRASTAGACGGFRTGCSLQIALALWYYSQLMVRSLRIGHRRYVLSPGVNTVGREPSSTVCINDPSVSRGHARVTIENGVATLEDLNSKNGTQVMGDAVRSPRVLNDGDEFEFGHVKGWYIVEESEDPPTTTHL